VRTRQNGFGPLFFGKKAIWRVAILGVVHGLRPLGPTLSPETSALLRCLAVVASVALLSGLLNHFQLAQGQFQLARGQEELASVQSASPDWVRTVDGWEPIIALESDPDAATPPVLHPLLVAGFQVTASLLALLAFPAVRTLAGARAG
jgi:hypothetical protein